MNNALPPELIREILDGRCLAFVGAGFSAAARLPDWRSLLQRVATDPAVRPAIRDHVDVLLEGPKPSASKFEQAAQLLEDELTRARFVSCVKRHLLDGAQVGESMRARLRYLKEIPFRAILTTNFDGFLSGALPEPKTYKRFLRPARHRWWNEVFWGKRHAGAPVVQLHGDLTADHPEEHLVLTRRDYRRRLYGDPGYMPFLHALLTTNTVLFMGTSFEDAYLNELRSQVLALFGYQTHDQPLAYALQNDVHELTREHFDRHEGIHVLNFDTLSGQGFVGFDSYLRSIWESTAIRPRFGRLLRGKRLLWVAPSPRHGQSGYRFLQGALRDSGLDGRAIITEVAQVDEAAQLLGPEATTPSFDLIICDAGDQLQTATALLGVLRDYAQRPPVIVFGRPELAKSQRRHALCGGAVAYCWDWETLFRTISELLAEGDS